MEKFKYLSKDKIEKLPKSSGVYAFFDGKKILYIGKAGNLKERVKNHFSQPGSILDQTILQQNFEGRVGYLKTESEIEALILEANLIKKYQPKYNVLWRDDKNYFYIAITKQDFPRVLITHQKKAGAQYLGPFIEGASLKRTLTFLRKVFPYYAAKKHPKNNCLWCNLKLCPGPNPMKSEYQKNIKHLIAVLRGKSKTVLRQLKKEMGESSLIQNYEKAGRIRDQIQVLEKVISQAKVLKSAWLAEDVIQPQWKFKRIEAYDVSNIQGQKATGSMVTFIQGKPDKNFYRKFKIKIQGKPNDVAMLKEILFRRSRHREWGQPDLILIDGGKAQLNAGLKGLTPGFRPKVMALAKKRNELFIEGRKNPVLLKKLPREIFNLILRLRDEAHRFAISYHKKLRQKELLEK